jgi:hypothetical protein
MRDEGCFEPPLLAEEDHDCRYERGEGFPIRGKVVKVVAHRGLSDIRWSSALELAKPLHP